MRPFAYTRASHPTAAIEALTRAPHAKFIAGGTNLIDLMKEDVERPEQLIDISRLELTRIEALPNGDVRLGALARNSDTANDPLVRTRYPLLAQAIHSGASPQLRNAATNGGNLMQRTRCPYFYDVDMPCNKRDPGAGCSALEGVNRSHAILGTSEKCIAAHPSDMCVALTALDATVQLLGPHGEHGLPFHRVHRLPGDTPQIETNLAPDELITAIDLPADAAAFARHSHYLKVRDRASFAFALVSVAVALEIEGAVIRRARVGLGGVAHKPWRATEAEKVLTGAHADAETFARASAAELQGARPSRHNSFKVELTQRAIVRALVIATGHEAAP